MKTTINMGKTATMMQKSPMIFSNQLVKELEWWKQSDTEPKPGHLLLQYVDDILIATEETDLLNFLGLNGY